MQTGNTNFIYRNEIDKACFEHDMTYCKSNDLTKRTQSDKVLRDKAFKIANNPKYDGYQRGLSPMVYKFFDKKSCGSGAAVEPNYQLTSELHRQIINVFRETRTIVNAFREIISEERKPNKIWVDQGGEFYNKLFKKFLKINNIEMYSIYNE